MHRVTCNMCVLCMSVRVFVCCVCKVTSDHWRWWGLSPHQLQEGCVCVCVSRTKVSVHHALKGSRCAWMLSIRTPRGAECVGACSFTWVHWVANIHCLLLTRRHWHTLKGNWEWKKKKEDRKYKSQVPFGSLVIFINNMYRLKWPASRFPLFPFCPRTCSCSCFSAKLIQFYTYLLFTLCPSPLTSFPSALHAKQTALFPVQLCYYWSINIFCGWKSAVRRHCTCPHAG